MKFNVFGDSHRPIIVLIHGVQTPWQIWTTQIESFRKNYCVIVPALDGHEEDRKSEYYSIQNEAEQIEDYCKTNYGKDILAICGISMGGAIAFNLWEKSQLNISKLIMDGAPLVPYGKLLTNMMTKEYLKITQKSKERDAKTLANFKKNFLPEKYLDSFLKIADNMSDSTIKNMVKSINQNKITFNAKSDGSNILYIHGTKMNEMLSKKSAKALRKHYPAISVFPCKGYYHCQKAIYEPDDWLEIVESFINQ